MRGRGHWGTLENVIGGPGVWQRMSAISVPRAKAAPRRKSVLTYPTLAYQHEQPSHLQRVANQRLRRAPRPATVLIDICECRGNGCALFALDRERPYQCLSSPAGDSRRLAHVRWMDLTAHQVFWLSLARTLAA